MAKSTTSEGRTHGKARKPQKAASAPEEGEPVSPRKYEGVREREWGKFAAEIRISDYSWSTNSALCVNGVFIVDGKEVEKSIRIWLGTKDTAEEAAKLYIAARKLFGRPVKGPFEDTLPMKAEEMEQLIVTFIRSRRKKPSKADPLAVVACTTKVKGKKNCAGQASNLREAASKVTKASMDASPELSDGFKPPSEMDLSQSPKESVPEASASDDDAVLCWPGRRTPLDTFAVQSPLAASAQLGGHLLLPEQSTPRAQMMVPPAVPPPMKPSSFLSLGPYTAANPPPVPLAPLFRVPSLDHTMLPDLALPWGCAWGASNPCKETGRVACAEPGSGTIGSDLTAVSQSVFRTQSLSPVNQLTVPPSKGAPLVSGTSDGVTRAGAYMCDGRVCDGRAPSCEATAAVPKVLSAQSVTGMDGPAEVDGANSPRHPTTTSTWRTTPGSPTWVGLSPLAEDDDTLQYALDDFQLARPSHDVWCLEEEDDLLCGVGFGNPEREIPINCNWCTTAAAGAVRATAMRSVSDGSGGSAAPAPGSPSTPSTASPLSVVPAAGAAAAPAGNLLGYRDDDVDMPFDVDMYIGGPDHRRMC